MATATYAAYHYATRGTTLYEFLFKQCSYFTRNIDIA